MSSQRFLKWLRSYYKKISTSIAFIPALIAFLFVILAVGMLLLDFSPTGKEIKAQMNWLRLKDASTARSISSVIAGGIISLTVFSFSMVMILLNQAASQMSNRVLYKLIGNRFQQIVLGIYIGTIIYALFLLTNIRDIDSGILVPAISTYLLIALAIIDIFLFIYFLHFITQSVKFETIIQRIYRDTLKILKGHCKLRSEPDQVAQFEDGLVIRTSQSGLYQGFDRKSMLQFCEQEQIAISIPAAVGTFLLEHDLLVYIKRGDSEESTSFKELESHINSLINIDEGQEIETHYYYGFKQLTEVAIKALSPGINDPGTAITSLQALGKLLEHRLRYYPENSIYDQQGNLRIIMNEISTEEIINRCLLPIWDYGQGDRTLRLEMKQILNRLNANHPIPVISMLEDRIEQKITSSD